MELDNNQSNGYIIAGQETVYEQHKDGSIWQFTGPACNTNGACPGWIKLDNNSQTRWIAAN